MSQFALSVIVIIAAMLTFTTLTFIVGPLVDNFQGKMNEKYGNWEGTPKFEKSMRVASGLGSWFFVILTFFTYVYLGWLFKVIIYKLLYTKEEQQQNQLFGGRI